MDQSSVQQNPRAGDTLRDEWKEVYDILRKFFFGCDWYEVYDFIEFIAQNHPNEELNESFVRHCNSFLESEVSAYRFVNRQIVRIVSEEEIEAVEDALRVKSSPVREHIKRALQMLADRQNPDYRNSIKESISAVESLVRTVTGNKKGTLGDLLNQIGLFVCAFDHLETKRGETKRETKRGQIYFSSHELSESCRRLAGLRKIDLTPFPPPRRAPGDSSRGPGNGSPTGAALKIDLTPFSLHQGHGKP